MKAFHKKNFGSYKGQEVFAYTFENEAAYQLTIMTYGATILRYVTPDRYGHFDNIVLGFEDFPSYVGNSPKYGASIGPVAGRIAGACFYLREKPYQLEVNNASNCNHSGSTGWDATLFQVKEVTNHGITLYTERSAGTGGFPGNLKVWISYRLTERGELEISYRVKTDQDTLVNPTNHSYFNLSGDATKTIDDHIFQLHTRGFYPIASDGIPKKSLDTTPSFVRKLNQGVLFGELFTSLDPQIQLVSGLDHPFALLKEQDQAGFLYHEPSGRFMAFKTDASCLVAYTANVVDESIILSGQPMRQHNGIALETQALPDAIHSSQKAEVILASDQTFTSKTIYHASIR